MYPYIEIINIKISSFHLLLLLAFLFGGLFLRRILLKLDFDKYLYMIILILSLIGGLIGSHILSLIEKGKYIQIFSLNLFQSGMNFLGGLLLAILIIFIFLKFYKKIKFIELLAALCMPLILGYIIGRFGCFLAGDGCYGIATNLPFGMAFPKGTVPIYQAVHPTPLYEILFCFILLTFLMKNFKYSNFHIIKYKIIFLSLVGYGLERFFIEFIRRNTLFYGLTQAQWISLFFIVFSPYFLWKYYKFKSNSNLVIKSTQNIK